MRIAACASLVFVLVGCSGSGTGPVDSGADATAADAPGRDAPPDATTPDATSPGDATAADVARSDGALTGGPGLPLDLQMTAQSASTTTLSWHAPAAGSTPVDHYRIYRNDAAYDTAPSTTYTDHAATGCEIVTLDAPATSYDYAVAAVDAAGHEGPRTTQYVAYGFRGAAGGSTWGNSDYSFGLVSLSWTDTTGAPVGGGTDIHAVFPPDMGGGFQPYSNAPQVPIYDLDIGGFRYLTFDIKADHAANDFFVGSLSRLPFGDVYGWVDVRAGHYATLADGVWQTVRIPLVDLHVGTTPFVGSIGAPYGTFQGAPYATLTVTSVETGAGVDNGGFVRGTGLTGGVFIVANDQNASVGTFHVQGPGVTATTTVASRSLTYQRTNMYKLDIGLNFGQPGGNVYFNNIAFTRE